MNHFRQDLVCESISWHNESLGRSAARIFLQTHKEIARPRSGCHLHNESARRRSGFSLHRESARPRSRFSLRKEFAQPGSCVCLHKCFEIYYLVRILRMYYIWTFSALLAADSMEFRCNVLVFSSNMIFLARHDFSMISIEICDDSFMYRYFHDVSIVSVKIFIISSWFLKKIFMT